MVDDDSDATELLWNSSLHFNEITLVVAHPEVDIGDPYIPFMIVLVLLIVMDNKTRVSLMHGSGFVQFVVQIFYSLVK